MDVRIYQKQAHEIGCDAAAFVTKKHVLALYVVRSTRSTTRNIDHRYFFTRHTHTCNLPEAPIFNATCTIQILCIRTSLYFISFYIPSGFLPKTRNSKIWNHIMFVWPPHATCIFSSCLRFVVLFCIFYNYNKSGISFSYFHVHQSSFSFANNFTTNHTLLCFVTRPSLHWMPMSTRQL